MLPQRRMNTLLEQAYTHQRTQCLYHNAPYTSSAFSLYSDHRCTREAFPSLTTNILAGHTDEVWNIQWSHDGNRLASAGKDKTAMIWRMNVSSGFLLVKFWPVGYHHLQQMLFFCSLYLTIFILGVGKPHSDY